MHRAIISAGHTSSDKGAVQGDLEEYKLTRKIADFVIEELKKQDVITLSVPEELDLRSRIDWINNTGYSSTEDDIAIEIHVNDGGLSGIEGWYRDRGQNDSFKLTKSVVDQICTDGNYKYQGVKSEYDHELKQLAFVHFLKPTSALVEVLYIDNPDDAKVLQDDEKLKEIGISIAKGIQNYWKSLKAISAETSNEESKVEKTTEEAKQTEPEIVQTPEPMQMSEDQLPFNDSMPMNDQFDEDDDILDIGSMAAGVAVGSAINNKVQQPTQTPVTPTTPTIPSIPTTQAPQQFNQMPAVQPPIGGYTQITFEERERRRKFIEDLYLKALGRMPSFQDSTYFINNWEGEVNLTLRMLDSQDHADIMQKAIDHDAMLDQIKEKDDMISRLKIEIRDKDGIIENLNGLVIEKNSHIEKLKAEAPDNGDKKMIDGKEVEKNTNEQKFTPPKTLAEKIKDFLSDFF
ncbi:N-acetylmuramoyl-L-alanine amidase [Candidatus Dojkabacteria bacterium]|uniref:N-acetylmuramoyl-L-alanine amidase n=1 Tax=Candidatus Dojkabacteria bacterium TaxID=2099670 RepID=A0A955RHK0_9BACT|nr:N-acetylmuramoyl-L-alanine amidase [Candidatus Dojkabacteria bacterium]